MRRSANGIRSAGRTCSRCASSSRIVGRLTEHERPVVELPDWAGRLQARFLELLPGTPMSRDNLASMEVDSVCDCDFPAVFGIAPTALAAVAPTYLGPAAARSSYDAYRAQGGR